MQFFVEENKDYDERNAKFVILYGDQQADFVVYQNQKDALILSQSRIELPVAGGTFDITVDANVSVTVANSDSDWLHQVSTKGLVSNVFSFSADPSELPDSVYTIYKESTKYDKAKVDALWDEFAAMAKTVTDHRLKDQNRLVAMGWLDKDSYSRLDAKTPYELFVDKTYLSVDVSSIYNDYGPKWYIEAVEDEDGNVSLVVPLDASKLPPAANWSVPFYLAAMELDNYYTITEGEGWVPTFPVEVSADRNTVTIKPLAYEDEIGKVTMFYPQMIGMDNKTYQSILENPVVSEIVLTRGWKDSSKEKSVSRRSAVSNVPVAGELPVRNYKQRTDFSEVEQLKVIEGTIMNVEQFEKRADRLIEKLISNRNDR